MFKKYITFALNLNTGFDISTILLKIIKSQFQRYIVITIKPMFILTFFEKNPIVAVMTIDQQAFQDNP